MLQVHPVDAFLVQSGEATFVHGLPEEVVAMLFAFFSRNPKTLRDTMINMVNEGHLTLPPPPPLTQDERVSSFHTRVTVGYGHKSVADHANVHWALEGVSSLVERDILSSRLLAATSKSTRFVNFKDAGFVTPQEWPDDEVRAAWDRVG